MMRRVLHLAEKGKFTVSPNPRVGCVIVQSHSLHPQIIGEGYHVRKGEAHAERIALRQCTQNPAGCTLYVNLEPCCHHGATPPCTQAIIEAGIQRVVVANIDPFEKVSGNGISLLQQNGIQVDTGLMADEAAHLNRFFFHRHTTRFPWVMLKAAVSLDGKMAAVSGDSKWITGEAARRHVHMLRAEYDAILVGSNTVRIDDPSLTVRFDDLLNDGYKPPVRVVLDTHASISMQSKLVQSAREFPVWVFASHQANESKIKTLQSHGVTVIHVSASQHGLDLKEVLQQLAERNILSLMVEGGSAVHTAFLEAGLVNELNIYTAPVLIGGKDAPSFFMGKGKDNMTLIDRLSRVVRTELGEDALLNGIVRNEIG